MTPFCSEVIKPGHLGEVSERRRYTEAEKEYAKCKKCPWPDGCHYPRCAGPDEKAEKKRGRALNAQLAAELWDDGASYDEIAAVCGVSVSTVTRWAYNTRRYRKAKKDPCPGCYVRELCQKKGMSCQSKRDYEKWRLQNG